MVCGPPCRCGRTLRGIAVGRRNWLFAGSKAGGERAAAIYTVIQTCKANGVDPQAYIADFIGKVADDWPASRWDELMPWNWVSPRRSAHRASRVTCGPQTTLTARAAIRRFLRSDNSWSKAVTRKFQPRIFR